MNPFSDGLDSVFWVLARLGLASLFFSAALHKARDFSDFAGTVRDYRILPDWASALGAKFLALGEAAVAVCLLVPGLDPLGPLGALGLLAVYSGAIGVNLARGRRHIDCGCNGFGQSRQTISGWLLVRNASLGLLPLLLLMAPSNGRPLGWLDSISIAAGLAMASLLWLAGHELARAGGSESGLGESS
jgi:uncharacterized membrane protein YphA (DoxX/SURF4 family)